MKKSYIISILIVYLISFSLLYAQPTTQNKIESENSTAQQWQEDLRVMAEEMPKLHKNLFHTITPQEFKADIKQLHKRIPRLERHQIIVEMARIVAKIGDGHTNIYPTRDPKINFRTLPIKLYLFKDSLFIRAAEQNHAELVGSKVIKIGNLSAEESVANVKEIIGRDNAMGIKFFAPLYLVVPEILHALKISSQSENIPLTIEKAGKKETVLLKPDKMMELLEADTDTTWLNTADWVDLRDNASNLKPLWLKDLKNKFWFEYLSDKRIVYAQINQVQNKENETLAEFSNRLYNFIENNPVEKLVLDLRLNRGGNGTLLTPLEINLIKSKINKRGEIFVITGRSTWSAAQFLIDHLEKYTNVLFVGEPSASKGNHYSDSRRITLPNSGITVRVSIYYWQNWMPWDTRPWISPDISAELTPDDYRNNRDPAMEVILNYKAGQSFPEIISDFIKDRNLDQFIKRYKVFKADPRHKFIETQSEMNRLGYRLMESDRLDDAIEIFKLNAESYPKSANVYDSLAEAYRNKGEKGTAIEFYKKSLELNPQNTNAVEQIKKLNQKK